MPSPHLIVLSTVPDATIAERIATTLVEERLAACVNTVPAVNSTYRWEGKVRTDREVMLVMKTAADRYPALRDRLLGLHPYATPELVALDIVDGNPRYLSWITESTRP